MLLRVSVFLALALSLSAAVCGQRREQVSLQVAGGKLGGELTVPAGPASVVALILPTSGNVDREGNGDMMSSNTLRLLSDSLAKRGIASLRYDKRGIGASKGLTDETRLRFGDYGGDAAKWLQWLRQQKRFRRVFIIGQGEGALVGMLAATKVAPDGLIAIESPGQAIDTLILGQLDRQGLRPGPMDTTRALFAELRATGSIKTVPRGPFYINIFRPTVQRYLSSWMQYSPPVILAGLRCPVLLVQGDNDLQTDTSQIRLLGASKPEARTVIIPGMNHIFRQAPRDPMQNMDTFTNPELPLDATLIREIVKFMQR